MTLPVTTPSAECPHEDAEIKTCRRSKTCISFPFVSPEMVAMRTSCVASRLLRDGGKGGGEREREREREMHTQTDRNKKTEGERFVTHQFINKVSSSVGEGGGEEES